MQINDCPFCHSGNVEVAYPGPDDWFVRCHNCGAYGPDSNPNRNRAIYRWNEPTDITNLLRADCERLRREIDELTNTIR